MANIIKILEQQLLFHLMEAFKQYLERGLIKDDTSKTITKVMRILSDEKNNQVANNILLTKKVNVMENVTDYKQILN